MEACISIRALLLALPQSIHEPPRDAIVGEKVFVAHQGRAVERTVVVQRTLQSLAVVEDGVQSGESLILTNLDIIHDGARIAIQSHGSLADELKKQRTKVARETLAGDGDGQKQKEKRATI